MKLKRTRPPPNNKPDPRELGLRRIKPSTKLKDLSREDVLPFKWWHRFERALERFAKALREQYPDPFDKEGYMNLPRKLFAHAAPHTEVKTRLLFYVWAKTLGGQYDYLTDSYRWLTKLPSFDELAFILKTDKDVLHRSKQQLIKEGQILEYKKGKSIWIGIHPHIVGDYSDLEDINQAASTIPGSRLRISAYSGIIWDWGDKETREEIAHIIKDSRDVQRAKKRKKYETRRKATEKSIVTDRCIHGLRFGHDWNQDDERCGDLCAQPRYVACQDKCDELRDTGQLEPSE